MKDWSQQKKYKIELIFIDVSILTDKNINWGMLTQKFEHWACSVAVFIGQELQVVNLQKLQAFVLAITL